MYVVLSSCLNNARCRIVWFELRLVQVFFRNQVDIGRKYAIYYKLKIVKSYCWKYILQIFLSITFQACPSTVFSRKQPRWHTSSCAFCRKHRFHWKTTHRSGQRNVRGLKGSVLVKDIDTARSRKILSLTLLNLLLKYLQRAIQPSPDGGIGQYHFI